MANSLMQKDNKKARPSKTVLRAPLDTTFSRQNKHNIFKIIGAAALLPPLWALGKALRRQG
jgi:hypothetical protein